MSRPSIAVVSQAVGPPWIDGMTNALLATTRQLPDYDFHFFGDRSWDPPEPHFHSSGSGQVGSWALRDKVAFVRWVSALEVDIAHVIFHPRPTTIGLLRPLLRNVSVVQTLQTRQPPDTDLSRLLVTDAITVVTNRIAEDVRRADPSLSPVVIPPAVDADMLPTNVDAKAVRASLGIPASGPLLVYAGNYTEALGVTDAADVFLQVADALPDVNFVMANRRRTIEDAGLESEIRRRLEPLGDRVTMLETVPDFRALLACAAALVFPAHRFDEHKLDLPLVILEAMALGVPVATYDVPPLDELPAASIACSAPVGGVTELATRLAGLLGDDAERRQVTREAAEVVRTTFSPAAAAAALDQVYRDVLASGSS